MAEEDKKDAEEELPAEEREELEQLFSMMDKNGDGELSSDELYEALTESATQFYTQVQRQRPHRLWADASHAAH